MDESCVIRIPLKERLEIEKTGRALLVFDYQIVAVAELLKEPIQVGRGKTDDEIWGAWKGESK